MFYKVLILFRKFWTFFGNFELFLKNCFFFGNFELFWKNFFWKFRTIFQFWIFFCNLHIFLLGLVFPKNTTKNAHLTLIAQPALFGYFPILKSGSAIDFDKSSTITTWRTKCSLFPASIANRFRIFFRFVAEISDINAPLSSSLNIWNGKITNVTKNFNNLFAVLLGFAWAIWGAKSAVLLRFFSPI